MAVIDAFGTLLKIGDGEASESFTTIANVHDISGPNLAMRTAEVTSHSSTGGWAEHVGTILEGGQLTFDIGYEPTGATHDATTGLINDMENRTERNFQVVFPDGSSTTWSFTALVTGFVPNEPVDGELRASVTLLITGQPTLA
jgi:predicted secreted protein